MYAKLSDYKNLSTKSVVSVLPEIINQHISFLQVTDAKNSNNEKIYEALRLLLNGHYEKYIFNEIDVNRLLRYALSNEEFQNILSNLNEKQESRKAGGVYYTPKDVTAFIVNNCLFNQFNGCSEMISDEIKEVDFGGLDVEEIVNSTSHKTIFDPTCGSGEFLLNAYQAKVNTLNKFDIFLDDEDYINIINTIHGNDINVESIEITKIRLFFEAVKHIKNANNYLVIARILNRNLHNEDFVNANFDKFDRYDVLIGNPPYVEDNKSLIQPNVCYGNIYANIIHNSISLLVDGGVLGFILPISYVSTPRMKRIRSFVENETSVQIVLNYADRPDCLFTSVHQKLTILFARKGIERNELYSSGYKYWYKTERLKIFKDNLIIRNMMGNDKFYPKIGNEIEHSVYIKLFTNTETNFFDLTNKGFSNKIYLNMRASFWIKAFSFNPGSSEYKSFGISPESFRFFLCLLNSSLFFWFWITVSDCWHITSKELKHFFIPMTEGNLSKFDKLSEELEKKLEKTKRYIGSVQTEYEYKHKCCKDIIDKIDDELANYYGVTGEEIEYIKNFALKYRESRGN